MSTGGEFASRAAWLVLFLVFVLAVVPRVH